MFRQGSQGGSLASESLPCVPLCSVGRPCGRCPAALPLGPFSDAMAGVTTGVRGRVPCAPHSPVPEWHGGGTTIPDSRLASFTAGERSTRLSRSVVWQRCVLRQPLAPTPTRRPSPSLPFRIFGARGLAGYQGWSAGTSGGAGPRVRLYGQ